MWYNFLLFSSCIILLKTYDTAALASSEQSSEPTQKTQKPSLSIITQYLGSTIASGFMFVITALAIYVIFLACRDHADTDSEDGGFDKEEVINVTVPLNNGSVRKSGKMDRNSGAPSQLQGESSRNSVHAPKTAVMRTGPIPSR